MEDGGLWLRRPAFFLGAVLTCIFLLPRRAFFLFLVGLGWLRTGGLFVADWCWRPLCYAKGTGVAHMVGVTEATQSSDRELLDRPF